MVVGVEQGIILAMALSIVEHIFHSYRPYDTLVALTPDGTPGPAPLERIAPRRCRAWWSTASGRGLYYANGTRFTEEIMDLVEGADLAAPLARGVRVRRSATSTISGADTIRQVKEELARTGVTFAICDLNPKVREQLDAYGLTELIGTDRIFATTTDLLAAYRASPDAAAAETPACRGSGTGPKAERARVPAAVARRAPRRR